MKGEQGTVEQITTALQWHRPQPIAEVKLPQSLLGYEPSHSPQELVVGNPTCSTMYISVSTSHLKHVCFFFGQKLETKADMLHFVSFFHFLMRKTLILCLMATEKLISVHIVPFFSSDTYYHWLLTNKSLSVSNNYLIDDTILCKDDIAPRQPY